MQTLQLNNVTVPKLGFGTWKLNNEECTNAVNDALQLGYRHIDTAQAYDNEEFVGQGWKNSGVKRDDFFLTTKIFRDQFETPSKTIKSVEESLEKLKTDYVDLLLVHWPFPEYSIEQLIEPIMAAQDKGLTRLIGVSNFTVEQLQQAKEISDNRICLNQVEYHPKLNQQPILDFVRQNGWGMTAYSPLGRGTAMDEPVIEEIAKKYNKSPAQVILRWLMQQDNVLAIPKSSSKDHMKSNFSIFDFELSSDEMTNIMDLRHENDRQVDPDFAPEWDKAA